MNFNSPAENDPEEKFKLLINGSIAVSILIISSIFIIIGVYSAKESDDVLEHADYQDDIYQTDTMNDPDAKAYYNVNPGSLDQMSDSLFALLGTAPNQYYDSVRYEFFRYLRDQSDSCALAINHVRDMLGDTLSRQGIITGPALTEDFFQRTQADKQLFTVLFEYRETLADKAADAGLTSFDEYRMYFPLKDKTTFDYYVQSWDTYTFTSADPIETMEHLRKLEIDLRKFENLIMTDNVQ